MSLNVVQDECIQHISLNRCCSRPIISEINKSIVQRQLREYDAAAQQGSDASERAEVLLEKAVLYGVFLRFDESRRSLEIARAQAPGDPDITPTETLQLRRPIDRGRVNHGAGRGS